LFTQQTVTVNDINTGVTIISGVAKECRPLGALMDGSSQTRQKIYLKKLKTPMENNINY
jgi:hypothetical protein